MLIQDIIFHVYLTTEPFAEDTFLLTFRGTSLSCGARFEKTLVVQFFFSVCPAFCSSPKERLPIPLRKIEERGKQRSFRIVVTDRCGKIRNNQESVLLSCNSLRKQNIKCIHAKRSIIVKAREMGDMGKTLFCHAYETVNFRRLSVGLQKKQNRICIKPKFSEHPAHFRAGQAERKVFVT